MFTLSTGFVSVGFPSEVSQQLGCSMYLGAYEEPILKPIWDFSLLELMLSAAFAGVWF